MEEKKQKRLVDIIINHWNEIKVDNYLPMIKDLNVAMLEQHYDKFVLIDLENLKEGKFNYKYVGSKVLDIFNSNETKPLNDKDNPFEKKTKILKVLSTCQPLIDEGSYTNINGDIVKYRQCFVPISAEGNIPDLIFGGANFKVYTNKD